MRSDSNHHDSPFYKSKIHHHENHLCLSGCARLNACKCTSRIAVSHSVLHRGTMSAILCNPRLEKQQQPPPPKNGHQTVKSVKYPHLAVEDIEHVVFREAVQPRAHPGNRGAYKVAPALFTRRHGLNHLALQSADIRSRAAVAHDNVVRLWHGHAAVYADFLPGGIRPPCEKAFRRLWIPHLI
jgi:hypothetical protein